MKVTAVIFIWLVAFTVSAASFYIRQDGSATKANAIGPDTDATACMSVTTHNGATYTAGDIIYLSSLGGDITTGFTFPTAGVIYLAVPGETPTVTTTVSFTKDNTTWGGGILMNGGSSYCLTANSPRTGLVISNVTIQTAQNYGIYDNGANMTIRNVSGYSASIFIRCDNSPSTSIDTVMCGSTHASAGTGVKFNTCTNIVLNNVTVTNTTSAGVWITDCHNLNLAGTNWNILGCNRNSGGNSAVYYVGSATPTNVYLYLSGLSISNCIGSGLRFNPGSTFNAGSGVSGFSIHNSTIHGIVSLSAPNLMYTNGTSYSNTSYGIHLNQCNSSTVVCCGVSNNTAGGIHIEASSGICTNVTLDRNFIYFNGQTNDVANNEDGIDVHTNCTAEIITRNIIWQNGNAGIAVVDGCTGRIENNTIAYNGTPGSTYHTGRGGFYATGYTNNQSIWNLTNNLFWANYPMEINSILGRSVPNADYNLYYHVGNSCVELQAFSTNGITTTNSWAEYHGTYEPHSIYGNPQCVSSSDFHLLANSPAINAGLSIGLTNDYAGLPIVGMPDIGAYEFQGGVKLLRIGSKVLVIQ